MSTGFCLNGIPEDEAVAIVGQTLADMSAAGVAYFSTSQKDSHANMRRALFSLSSFPDATLVCDAVVQQALIGLLPEIRRFQSSMQDLHCDPLDALRSLHDTYARVQAVLSEWCGSLGCSEGIDDFRGHVRCEILQLDLLSAEAPTGRTRLLQFLRDHCSAFLAQREEEEEEEDHDEEKQGGGNINNINDAESEPSEREGSPVLTLNSAVDVGGVVGGSSSRQFNDETITLLHNLFLTDSSTIKSVLFESLDDCIMRKLSDMDADFTEHCIKEYLSWEERIIEPFIALCLCGGRNMFKFGVSNLHRDEISVWSTQLRSKLLRKFAENRIGAFWDIMVEYPDSIPALEDIRFCLQSSGDDDNGLKEQLMNSVRALLASRLHRAGTRTEDILAMLIKTINSLCVLFPRNERSTVLLSVISSTLEHLRKRKDCVPAVVQVITHADSAFYNDLKPVAGTMASYVEGGDDVSDGEDGAPDGVVVGEARERPDVLRVLLTAITIKDLVHEYRQVLAEQLLSKPVNDFDTINEEEVLEHLKCTFGETALSSCTVMIHDMQMSRRITLQLRDSIAKERARRRSSGGGPPTLEHEDEEEDEDEPRGRGSVVLPSLYQLQSAAAAAAAAAATVEMSPAQSSEVVPASALGATVLSSTCWPKVPSHAAGGGLASTSGAHHVPPAADSFTPHPTLQGCMDSLARHFKLMRVNQKLVWMLSQSRVSIEVTQLDPTRHNAQTQVPLTVSLLCASAILFTKELADALGGDVPAEQVAAKLGVSVDVLRNAVAAVPSVIDSTQPSLLKMQRYVQHSENIVFDEAQEAEEDTVPGVDPEQIKVLQKMISTMLKTRGAKSVNEIHNSMKMFGQFTGTPADMKKLLQKFTKEGVLVQTESKLFSLPFK